MRFDYCIGNPPYQESRNDTKDIPLFHDFMDAAYTIANKVELITPAKFLFNAGATPKKWNEKMLSDEHLKVLQYNTNAQDVFPTTGFKGGVAVTYRDAEQDFGEIGIFSSYPELNSIRSKAAPKEFKDSLPSIMILQLKFDLDTLYSEHPEYKDLIGSEGKERRLTSNIFNRLSFIFTNEKENDDDIKVIGLIDNKRVWKYIPYKYLDHTHKNLKKYKVLVPKSNGSGAIGEVLSTPLIGEPLIGYTFSFIGIGACDTKTEADNIMKYIKSKFARTMLGILKITQDNTPEKWRYVPLQDFTSNSDIPWNKSVKEIDQYLYQKYGFSQEEIDFIEDHVKEMN